MPTNILRRRGAERPNEVGGPDSSEVAGRRIVVEVGRVTIRAELLGTATAARLLAALPLYSTAETWGGVVRFEVPVETGRERGARVLVQAGDIAFEVEDDRVVIAYAPTPISRPGEIRLGAPANVWARALDDVTLLNRVAPGEKVSIKAV